MPRTLWSILLFVRHASEVTPPADRRMSKTSPDLPRHLNLTPPNMSPPNYVTYRDARANRCRPWALDPCPSQNPWQAPADTWFSRGSAWRLLAAYPQRLQPVRRRKTPALIGPRRVLREAGYQRRNRNGQYEDLKFHTARGMCIGRHETPLAPMHHDNRTEHDRNNRKSGKPRYQRSDASR